MSNAEKQWLDPNINGIVKSANGETSKAEAGTDYSLPPNSAKITGYVKASAVAAIAQTDTINQALGKLEKGLDSKQASGSYVPTSRTINSKPLSANIELSPTDIGADASGTAASAVTTHNENESAHQSLFDAKQAKITATGMLKGNGTGGVSAASVGVDYASGTHTHGNISNDGRVGTDGGKVVTTGVGGAIQSETENSAFNKPFNDTATNVKMDGTQAAGTSQSVARADHIHPSDTSKQSTINASGILKGTGGGDVKSAIAGIDYANVSAILSGTLSTTWLGDSAPYSQVVTVTNMTASANGVAGLSSTATNAQISAASAALLFVSAQATDSITIVAYGIKPEIEIPLQFLIVG